MPTKKKPTKISSGATDAVGMSFEGKDPNSIEAEKGFQSPPQKTRFFRTFNGFLVLVISLMGLVMFVLSFQLRRSSVPNRFSAGQLEITIDNQLENSEVTLNGNLLRDFLAQESLLPGEACLKVVTQNQDESCLAVDKLVIHLSDEAYIDPERSWRVDFAQGTVFAYWLEGDSGQRQLDFYFFVAKKGLPSKTVESLTDQALYRMLTYLGLRENGDDSNLLVLMNKADQDLELRQTLTEKFLTVVSREVEE